MDGPVTVAMTFQSAQMTRPVTLYYDHAPDAVREALALHLAGARVELERTPAPYWAHVEDRQDPHA